MLIAVVSDRGRRTACRDGLTDNTRVKSQEHNSLRGSKAASTVTLRAVGRIGDRLENRWGRPAPRGKGMLIKAGMYRHPIENAIRFPRQLTKTRTARHTNPFESTTPAEPHLPVSLRAPRSSLITQGSAATRSKRGEQNPSSSTRPVYTCSSLSQQEKTPKKSFLRSPDIISSRALSHCVRYR